MAYNTYQMGSRAYPLRRIVEWRTGETITDGYGHGMVALCEVLECGHEVKRGYVEDPDLCQRTKSRRCHQCATPEQHERAQDEVAGMYWVD